MTTISQAVAERDNAPAKVSPRQALQAMIERNSGAIALSLPKSMNGDRFKRLLLTAANTTPALFECDPTSFLAAGVTCAQLGLEPNDPRGLAYLIPFNDKKRGKVVQTIIGYRGMLELARRSGKVGAVHAFVVREGDEFDYTLGLEPTLTHRPKPDNDEAAITHVYAVAKVHVGTGAPDPQFVVLTKAQIDKARASSRGADSSYSPWTTHYAEMATKTALRRLCKLLPLTVEVADAIEHDERPMTLTDVGVANYEPADHPDAIETGEAEPEPDVAS